MKLNKRVEFSKEVAPICLPTPDMNFPDIPGQAPSAKGGKNGTFVGYVAGWGAAFSQCDSDDFGPSPHTPCKFPFVYKGQTYEDCSKDPPPSSGSKICHQFFRWLKQADKQAPADDNKNAHYLIYYWNSKTEQPASKSCFATQAFEHGWCGTCYPGELEPGQEGYCDKYKSGAETNTEEEHGKPREDKNWGWCSNWCGDKEGPSQVQTLQETQMDILTPKECKDLGADLNADEQREFCTGRKTSFPWIHKFKRVKNSNGKIIFTSEGKEVNYLGAKKTKYPFYLGGTDSCQGDSGGPFFRFHKERAYQTGVVSRGTGCANFNQPGIFSRVKSHLEWIAQNTKDGNCDG